MFKALNKYNESVSIENANVNEFYFCQICNQKLKQVHSINRAPHFSHIGKPKTGNKNYIPCTDRWHYCKTEWHREWQKRFPEECQECVVSNGTEKHIADVLINNTVIEFQHSSISIDEFRERNYFYTQCGYKVVWIFDMSLPFKIGEFQKDSKKDNKLYWRSAPKLFRNMNLKEENITLIFQFIDTNDEDFNVDEEANILVHVTHAYKEFSELYLKRLNGFSVKNFIETINNGSFFANVPSYSTSQEQISKVKNGKTILDLWSSDYDGIVVQNLINRKEMIINGHNGVINRENKNPNGKIIGKYSSKDIDGKFVYSKLYVVWDAEQPIWKLLHTFERKDIEYQVKKIDDTLSKYNGCDSLTNIVIQNKKNNIIVHCLYNDKTYMLNFVDNTNYNASQIDLSSGEISSQGSENYFVYPFRNKKIWKLMQPENDA